MLKIKKAGEVDLPLFMSTLIYTTLLVLLDQLSKIIVTKINSNSRLDHTVIKGFFNITYAENTGAAFSILEGKRVYFIVITLVVITALIFYFVKEKPKGIEKICLILIIAGAIGNLIDRIIHGYVTDFLNFNIFGYDFPIFNIADSYITVGAILLIIIELLKGDKKNARD